VGSMMQGNHQKGTNTEIPDSELNLRFKGIFN
jgi:hypothetical protein